MVSVLRGLAITLVLTVSGSACAASGVHLCEALETIGDGEVRSITVSGLLVADPELTVLYDPKEPRCDDRVQPAVWVSFEAVPPPPELKQILSKSGRAIVVISGELHGPRLALPDVSTLASPLAAKVRVSKRRYGHMGEFRAKLVVKEVMTASQADESTPRLYEWRESTPRCLPRVIKAPAPTYPELARTAGITGEVLVRYKVAAGEVVSAEALSGDRMLAEDAVQYVRELEFKTDVDAVLECLFSFELEPRSCDEGLTARVELSLPTRIKITGARHLW